MLDEAAGPRLPEAYVSTGEHDLPRDEGEDHAERLKQSGVACELKRYDGMNHGFLNWVGLVDRSSEALDATGAWPRRNL